MGQIYTERKESGNDKLPILTVSIHTGVSDGALDETELGKRVKRSEDKSTYKIARKNDLVFNMMRAWQGAIGTVRTTGMVSPAYIVAYPNDLVEPIFMDYLVKCKQMIDSIHRLSYGVTDFRLRLYWDSFVEIPINVPSLEEQNKIASFLTLLDKRIAKQRELVENLKSYKRGLLLRLFPHNGHTNPILRLKNISDKWCVAKLGDLLTTHSFKNYIKNPETNGTYPIIQQGDKPIIGYANGIPFSEFANIVIFGDHTLSLYKPNSPFFVSSDGVKILSSSKISGNLLYYILSTYMPNSEGYKRHFSIIKEVFVSFPESNDEQNKLAILLLSLDNRINKGEQLHSELLSIKKSLLQQMFI